MWMEQSAPGFQRERVEHPRADHGLGGLVQRQDVAARSQACRQDQFMLTGGGLQLNRSAPVYPNSVAIRACITLLGKGLQGRHHPRALKLQQESRTTPGHAGGSRLGEVHTAEPLDFRIRGRNGHPCFPGLRPQQGQTGQDHRKSKSPCQPESPSRASL